MKYLTKTLQSVLPATILLLTIGATSLTDVMALPRDRADGRREARDYRQDGRYEARGSRQEGRQTSRARRRYYWGMPPGCRAVRVGAHMYYHAHGVYYYPYYYGGRQVYVEVNVNGPLPRAEEIYDDLGFH